MNEPRILLLGERLQHRAFNGSNQALPWLASALHNHGFSNTVQFDLENPQNTLGRALHEAELSDLILFAGTFSVQLDQIDRDAAMIRGHLNAFDRETPIIVGGYGSAGVERYSAHAPFIDAFHYGPGIDSVIQIANAVKDNRFFRALRSREIPGLSFWDAREERFVRGKPVSLPSVEALGAINQLFLRDYQPRIHDMGDIFFDEDGNPLPTFQLVTELGCPYICTFCSESGAEEEQMFLGRGVREVPLEAIADTFARAHNQGYRAVYFDIETAFRNWNRMEQILELMNEAGLVGGLNTRIDTVSKERLERASSLGATYAFYGVEHLNPQVLLAIDKFAYRDPQRNVAAARAYQTQVRDVFSWMGEARVQSSLYLIMGLPKIADASWKLLVEGQAPEELEYARTSLEDDVAAIREAFALTQPSHFNANILRLNPDTAMAWQPRYAMIRPSGRERLDAVWFVPRVAEKLGLQLQDPHPIYRFFEGVESNQPYSTAMDPERAHRTAEIILEEANRHGSHVYFDSALEEAGFVWRRNGEYGIAPLREFENLRNGEEPVPTGENVVSLRSKKRGWLRRAGAAAAAVIAAVGLWMYADHRSETEQERAYWVSIVKSFVEINPIDNGLLPEYVAGDKPIEEMSRGELDRILSLVTTNDPKDYYAILKNPETRKDIRDYHAFQRERRNG